MGGPSRKPMTVLLIGGPDLVVLVVTAAAAAATLSIRRGTRRQSEASSPSLSSSIFLHEIPFHVDPPLPLPLLLHSQPFLSSEEAAPRLSASSVVRPSEIHSPDA